MKGFVGLAIFLAATSANAAQYRLSFTGTVSSLATLQNFTPIAVAPTTISVGDAFNVTYLLETAGRQPDAYFANDPSINIYAASVTGLSVRIGQYVEQVHDTAPFATIQIWNNRLVEGVGLVDSFTIGVLDQKFGAPTAFDLGAGSFNEQFHFQAYDFTASGRSSDNIEQVVPFSAYGSWSGHYSGFNTTTQTIGLAQLNFATASIVPVPETGEWAMMAAGLAIIGGVARRRRGVRA